MLLYTLIFGLSGNEKTKIIFMQFLNQTGKNKKYIYNSHKIV
uniref:Uncharacterized protein n=1 Tax=uncultured bacterium contig00031 TaxID=1181520 RepID=A0A806KEE8_9BACT|nr:hypothetical protein [uncultured bacterium contig00031]